MITQICLDRLSLYFTYTYYLCVQPLLAKEFSIWLSISKWPPFCICPKCCPEDNSNIPEPNGFIFYIHILFVCTTSANEGIFNMVAGFKMAAISKWPLPKCCPEDNSSMPGPICAAFGGICYPLGLPFSSYQRQTHRLTS
jgi:hypothetical protein